MRQFLRAVGAEFIEPVDYLGLAATLLDQAMKVRHALALALFTGNDEHIELADQIIEGLRRRGPLGDQGVTAFVFCASRADQAHQDQ